MTQPTVFRLSLLALAGLVTAEPVQAQSTVRPVPRIERHELALFALAPDVVDGPRSRWAELEGAPAGDPVDATDFGLRGRGVALDEADLSDAPGTVSTQRAGWDALLARRFETGGLVAVGLETEASFYDFGGAGPVASAADPFNDLYESRLRSTYYAPLDRELSLFTGVELAFGGEDEADLTSGVTAGGAVGVGFRASDALEVSLGVAGASRLEDDAYVLPFIGIDWRLTESTRLVAEGPEVRLEQRLSPELELHLLADYAIRQFRLNGEGPLDGGAFRDEQIDLGLGLFWSPSQEVRVGAEVGATVWRELTFLGADGSDLGVTEVDRATWVGLTLSASF